MNRAQRQIKQDALNEKIDDAELPHGITIKDREHHVIERDIP